MACAAAKHLRVMKFPAGNIMGATATGPEAGVLAAAAAAVVGPPPAWTAAAAAAAATWDGSLAS